MTHTPRLTYWCTVAVKLFSALYPAKVAAGRMLGEPRARTCGNRMREASAEGEA